MTNDSLLRNKSTYLTLMIFTGLTGGYNFYLDRPKKALIMMNVFLLSVILCFAYGIGLIGIIINSVIWIKDFCNLKKDIDSYNKNIKNILLSDNAHNKFFEIKKKNVLCYNQSILLFGILGLEDLYLEDYNLKKTRFIINNLYILALSIIAITISICFIYLAIKYPGSDHNNYEGLEALFAFGIIMMYFLPIILPAALGFPIVPVIMTAVNLCTMFSKMSMANSLVSECTDSLKEQCLENKDIVNDIDT